MVLPDNINNASWLKKAVADHEGRLLRYAMHLTGDINAARDVVQDTFLKLCRAERKKIEGHLTAWLFTVCRNRALEIKRKEKRMQELPDEQIARQPALDPDPADTTGKNEAIANVLEALKTLSKNQQEVIRLRFQNGLSYKEISSVTNMSVSNVGVIIHAAVRKLQTQLVPAQSVPHERRVQ